MMTYWLPKDGSAEHFWQHEWRKHGTCVNTLATSCYSNSNYIPGMELVDYFQKAVDLFKRLDTYKTLASEGIIPSNDKKYSAAHIQRALSRTSGSNASFGCNGHRLNQIWYAFNIKGSLQTGEFIPATPGINGWPENCPTEGIQYLPKIGSKRSMK